MTAGTPNDENKKDHKFADPSPLPAEVLITKEEARRVERALETLTEYEKQVVLLRLYEGLPFKDIADMMKCPLNTTLGRMHNALKKLRKELGKEGVDHEM
jgi:RNA polymerase sigma-70 factor (ECF subfamily)